MKYKRKNLRKMAKRKSNYGVFANENPIISHFSFAKTQKSKKISKNSKFLGNLKLSWKSAKLFLENFQKCSKIDNPKEECSRFFCKWNFWIMGFSFTKNPIKNREHSSRSFCKSRTFFSIFWIFFPNKSGKLWGFYLQKPHNFFCLKILKKPHNFPKFGFYK